MAGVPSKFLFDAASFPVKSWIWVPFFLLLFCPFWHGNHLAKEETWLLCLLYKVSLCLLGNLSCFLSSVNIFKINLLNDSFRNIIRVSSCLDPDQARHFVGPDDILSGLIWIQTVCKCYQQTTIVAKRYSCSCQFLCVLVSSSLVDLW